MLLVAAVAAAGYLAFRGMRGAPPPPEPRPAAPATIPDAGANGDTAFPTFADDPPKRTDETPAPAQPTEPPAVEPEREPPAGTPVADGENVSLTIPYRAGTKSRYRVMEASLARDLQTNLVSAWRFVWEVTAEVTQGDGSGAARVRFTVDAFKYQSEAMGRPIAVDSRHPDPKLLDDPQLGLGRLVRPLLATCGVPVEFVIAPTGAIGEVEGADALRRAYLDVVDSFGADAPREALDAPDAESLRERWSETLFPALGGGELAGGARRDASLRTTVFERWAVVTKGSLRATHDDPGGFRVEFRGTPAIEEVNRPARTAVGRAVEKMRVDASADSFRASWHVDRAAGRVTWGKLEAKYRAAASSRTSDGTGYSAQWTNVERLTTFELLPD